jgi:cyclopropane fatty-acyl-phospholipid synthase-like methyltransferase
MYGSAELDPVVKYYDLAFAAGATADIAWFSHEAAVCGATALDLGCGTGRISIAMARLGVQVVAIDNSEGMLSIFKGRLSSEPAEIRSRIQIQQQSMADFHLNRRFHSVTCCDAFFHNLTPKEEMDCLTLANRHLRKGGIY